MTAARFRRAARAFRQTDGVSAVEFALIAPIFALILVGTIDVGSALYVKFRLTGVLSAAANYALVNAANVNSSSGTSLASNLAAILSSNGNSTTGGTVVVNNGPTATLSGGSVSTGGTASNADSCYCPTLSGSAVTWGSAISCGNTCSNGSLAGKYVSILASQAFTPNFANYGIVRNGTVSTLTVVQAQ